MELRDPGARSRWNFENWKHQCAQSCGGTTSCKDLTCFLPEPTRKRDRSIVLIVRIHYSIE